jgi:hypothetical protein
MSPVQTQTLPCSISTETHAPASETSPTNPVWFSERLFYLLLASWKSVISVACWKWFKDVLKEAGVEVTDSNKKRIDQVIHEYIGSTSSYGHCSDDWKKTRKEIRGDKVKMKELVEKVKKVV